MNKACFVGTMFLVMVCLPPLGRAGDAWGQPLGRSFTAGTPDEFSLPTESPVPSAHLIDYTSKFWPQRTTRLFDMSATDVALIHTFTGWKARVCGATLEIRLRGGPDPLSTNDSIRLGLKGGTDHQQAFHYWVTIRRVVGSWGPGSEATLTLDLAHLPVYGGFPTDILFALSDGELELLVEDDTAVDYATLTVCGCNNMAMGPADGKVVAGYPGAGSTAFERTTWGRLKTVYRGGSK